MTHYVTLRRGLLGGVLALALAAGAVVLTTPDVGQAQGADAEPQIRVGTYNPEQTFTAYHGREALMQQFQELQMEAQQAQNDNDQERLMEIQQELQQAEQEAVDTFQRDVEEAVSAVAEEAGLQVVAVGVIYTADDVEPQDVTEQLIEKVNEGHDVPEPVAPEMGDGQ